MMNKKKLQIWLPLILSAMMVAGMYLGYNLKGNTKESKNFFNREKRSSLQEVLDLIDLKYVDSVKIDSIQDVALQIIMSELDPHSVYIPASSLQEMNDDIAGNFGGIGIEFNIFRDTVHVLNVISGGPSEKAGIEVTDKIITVNKAPVSGKEIDSDKIKKMIRGDIGSKLTLGIFRNNQIINIELQRGMIDIPSIDAAYMLNKTTAYIRLNKFSVNSYREFMQNMEKLQKQGMQNLIFDLRGNGGGLMNEAVNMMDEFLDEDKLIVYTQGLNTAKREYRGIRDGIFEKGKLVILVDELSASASEVIAGAIQDWDRGSIIGRRTFGKGLVQEQYPLSNGSAIRLTVARYYTPVGRSIQRPYENGKKVYMDELWERYLNGELSYSDSNKVTNGKEYKTKAGRPVYGSGGIMPDIFVPIDSQSNNRMVTKLILSSTFNNFIYDYYTSNKAVFNNYKNTKDLVNKFSGMPQLWNDLSTVAGNSGIDMKSFNDKTRKELELRILASFARFKWRTEGYHEVLNMKDKMVEKAMEVFSK
jgi:carboxyl-terminal processing protease